MQDQEAAGAGGEAPPVHLVVADEPRTTDPEILRRRQELARAGYPRYGGGQTLPGRWRPTFDEDGDPVETRFGPPTESYQERCERHYWETIGGTRPGPNSAIDY
jgi:hypothetical protein